jgi:hypothetical protein
MLSVALGGPLLLVLAQVTPVLEVVYILRQEKVLPVLADPSPFLVVAVLQQAVAVSFWGPLMLALLGLVEPLVLHPVPAVLVYRALSLLRVVRLLVALVVMCPSQLVVVALELEGK